MSLAETNTVGIQIINLIVAEIVSLTSFHNCVVMRSYQTRFLSQYASCNGRCMSHLAMQRTEDRCMMDFRDGIFPSVFRAKVKRGTEVERSEG